MLSIGFQPPACRFIFDGSVIVLKCGIALLPWFLAFTVLVEARDGRPGSISRRLTRPRLQADGKVILFCQKRAIALPVIFAGIVRVPPGPEGCIANELRHPYG